MTTTIESLQDEVAALRQRVAELEQTVERLTPYREMFEHMPFPAVLFRTDGMAWAMNRQHEEYIHTPREAIIEKYTILDDPEAEEQGYTGAFHRAMKGEVVRIPPTSGDPASAGSEDEGRQSDRLSLYFPLYDEQQEIYAVGSISTDITDQRRQKQALRASEERLRAIIEKIPVGVCITGEDQRFEYVNPTYCETYHYPPEELIGQPFTIVVPPENRQQAADLHDAFMREGTEIRGEWHVVTREGTPLTVLADAAAIIGEDGRPKKATFVIDITALKQAEQDRLSLQQQVIEAQQMAIRELSTPLLPLAENVVALPLVGTIDSARAQQVMETLLEGVAQFRAEVAIVDITGVSVVDSQVANALIQAAQAVNLLGARVVLTGIGPAIAQTLVGLGVDLGAIVTRGNLQSGIAYALNRETG